ncbi:MAG: pyruvate, phosphate dikinase, partial [Pseudomonadota bacterium]
VRSGAAISMPGMMDTVLNLGLNDATVEGLANTSGDDRFAWDSYRRFIQMYGDVVMGVDHGLFEEALEICKEDNGFYADTELSADDWKALVSEFKGIVESEWGKPFPQDVTEQLWGAIRAVFDSWDSDRAKVYRRLNDIPGDWGTAVNVQAMVFGNMGDTSATGVAFTRDPATGERAYYGEYLINAQGEDVVAGIRTPQYLTKLARETAGAKPLSMEEAMPDAYTELARVFDLLESHYKDMQDIEFTVERGKLWMLQTRSGKRTAKAALRMAVEMEAEGLIDRKEAVRRVDPMALDQLLHPTLDPEAERSVLGSGLPASPGAAAGKIVLDADTAEQWAERGEKVILVRVETSPEDIHGMHAAQGILTARGGMTSHAAVVARGMGRPCVSGANAVSIDRESRSLRIGYTELKEGDEITLDGANGQIMLGIVPTVEPELAGDFGTLMVWADALRRMKVRTNAETPADCKMARQFGAEGIGLCRTEHMFFDASRIKAVRQMILAEEDAGRHAALEVLLPEQRADFTAIFEVMAGLPCTIRLLDPPLHEFLPTQDADFEDLADATGLGVAHLKRRTEELHEFNPMLGHRGCRLGITFPEIYEMQARAIFEAVCDVKASSGEAPLPEIMIPLVATQKELALLKALVQRVAEEVFAEKGTSVDYLVGTMIELPRAALMAGEIAQEGAFFSFGTNDLTQTTLGVSRDDSAKFLAPYVEKGIFPRDPFVSLDVEGVGQLVELAAERGRATRPDIKLGICGEHGGDPASIAFCEQVGLDYVSASPYRVPIARLAAAQAALK